MERERWLSGGNERPMRGIEELMFSKCDILIILSSYDNNQTMITEVTKFTSKHIRMALTLNPEPPIQCTLSHLLRRKVGRIKESLKNNKKTANSLSILSNTKDSALFEGLRVDKRGIDLEAGEKTGESLMTMQHSRLSSYQIYKERQKIMKSKHHTKVQLLKQKYLQHQHSPKRSKQSSKQSEQSPKQSNQLNHPLQVKNPFIHQAFAPPTQHKDKFKNILFILNLPPQTTQSTAREITMKTAEGRTRKIDSRSYLKRTNAKKQMDSFLNVFSCEESRVFPFTPVTRSIVPINTSLGYWASVKSISPKNCSVSRSKIKQNKKLNHAHQKTFRPWSPLKNEVDELGELHF